MLETTKNETGSVKPISALFKDGETARKAVNLLTDMGYDNNEINVIVTDDTQGTYFAKSEATDAASETQHETKAGPAAAGMASLGALLGAATAIGVTIATAGGSLLVMGPIAAGGAAMGAGVGGLFGGLFGSSVSSEESTFYEQAVHEGRILVHANTHKPEDWQQIQEQWSAIGGEFISDVRQEREAKNAT